MQIEIFEEESAKLQANYPKFIDIFGQEFFIVDGILLIIKKHGNKEENGGEAIPGT